jgi:citrate lyase subunit beta/citryl-CoA lyase
MPGRENLWQTMSLMILAARAHGLGAIDATHNDIRDEKGLAASCKQGRLFGFDGKTLIHPAQIDTANKIFAPTAAELDEARRILGAFEQNPGKSVLAFGGRMIEKLHAEEAMRLLVLAEAIEKRC